MIFAYGRVSSREQSTDAQIPELEKYGFDELISDKISGKVFQRKGLERLKEKLRPEDVLLVWRLDRLGRSMIEVLNLVSLLKSKGVHLVSLKDGVDTRTAVGNLMLGLMASLAEYEFSLLKERQRAGIEARKLKGLPTGIYARFASHLFDTDVRIHYSETTDDFNINCNSKNVHIWDKYAIKSQSRTYDGIALLKHALVNTTPDITKKTTIDDKEVKVRDMEAIQMANTKIDEIRTAFTDWLHAQNDEFKKRLTDQYNDTFNCFQ